MSRRYETAKIIFMKKRKDCDICYQIVCKRCGWKADEDAVLQIQKGEMTACPKCGWRPGDTV